MRIFDAFAAAGGKNIALDLAFPVTTTGTIQVTLTPVVSNPKISAIEILPGASSYRINAGGPAFTDIAGRLWSADKFFLNGYAYGVPSNYLINGALHENDKPLYRTERFSPGTLQYSFPVPNGRYSVNLSFAEIWFTAPNLRRFNILVNNQMVDMNFSPEVVNAEPNVEGRSIIATVTAGVIDIKLVSVLDNPKISAIEIAPLEATVPGLSPSKVEVNLSAVPIDRYNSLNSNNGSPLVYGCPTTDTVKTCFRRLLFDGPNNWRSQGVTGVRFFFTLAGGHFSTPFNEPGGSVNTQWSTNMRAFLSDLRSYGITHVTPTPVFDTWSGTSMISRFVSMCPDSIGNMTVHKTLNFVRWLPYGLDPADSNYPDRSCGNNSYTGSAPTPDDIFWGWYRFFDLVGQMLDWANTAAIQVNAFDYFQESNMSFTVMARMIYDPHHGSIDVLQGLRTIMLSRNLDPGRIAPSVIQDGTPFPATFDCPRIMGIRRCWPRFQN